MKKGFALATVGALMIALGIVAFVPTVRAQVGEILGVWFRFEPFGGGEYGIAVGGSMQFTPLQPTYRPAGFQRLGSGLSVVGTADEESVELTYHNDEQFVSITPPKAPADKPLPAGQAMTVSGQPAVLVTDLEGTFEYGYHIPKDALVETFGTPSAHRAVPLHSSFIAYTGGKRLTWYASDVKVDMLSNLSKGEMLKIAESLVPAEAGEGEPPFQSLLPGGEEGRLIIPDLQEGSIESHP